MNGETPLWVCLSYGFLSMPLLYYSNFISYDILIFSGLKYVYLLCPFRQHIAIYWLWPKIFRGTYEIILFDRFDKYWRHEETGIRVDPKVQLCKIYEYSLLILFEYPIYSLHITFTFLSMILLLCPNGSWLWYMWPPIKIPHF